MARHDPKIRHRGVALQRALDTDPTQDRVSVAWTEDGRFIIRFMVDGRWRYSPALTGDDDDALASHARAWMHAERTA